MFVLSGCGALLPLGGVLSCGDGNVDLHVYCTLNVAVVNYFGTQVPEVERIGGCMQIGLANVHRRDLADPKDQFTVSDMFLSGGPVVLAVRDFQVESYEDREVLIECAIADPVPFRDVVECVINDVGCIWLERIGLHSRMGGWLWFSLQVSLVF